MTLCSVLIFGIAFALNSPLEPEILKALNQLRADPAAYVAVLREQRRHYRGNLLEIPGRIDLRTQEGVRPLDEAIVELESLHTNLGRVALSSGLSRAAADHVIETGGRGLIDHSNFQKRIDRHGTWSGAIGEDISYGRSEAREIVFDLIVDDGVADRGHRKSLLDPRWRYVGIACGFHARYGTMCVLDFASSYRDR
jgi:hypothetical protein